MFRRAPTKLPDLLSNQSRARLSPGLARGMTHRKNKANTFEAVRAAALSPSIGEQDRFLPTLPRFLGRTGHMLPGSLPTAGPRCLRMGHKSKPGSLVVGRWCC